MSLNDIGKDIWSIISSYLPLIDFKSLRLTNKEIENKVRKHFFSTFVFHMYRIPLFENISEIRKILITRLEHRERVKHSKAHITHLDLGSTFNYSIDVPLGVTHLDLGYSFNLPIVVPPTVVHLNMGFKFNQPIVIPPSVISLLMSYHFDEPITIPMGIRHLYFGVWFNQPIVLPPSVTHLLVGQSFTQSITLPPNLQYFCGPYRWETIIPTNIKADYF